MARNRRVRYLWLENGYGAVLDDGVVITRDDTMTTLGVDKCGAGSLKPECAFNGI